MERPLGEERPQNTWRQRERPRLNFPAEFSLFWFHGYHERSGEIMVLFKGTILQFCAIAHSVDSKCVFSIGLSQTVVVRTGKGMSTLFWRICHRRTKNTYVQRWHCTLRCCPTQFLLEPQRWKGSKEGQGGGRGWGWCVPLKVRTHNEAVTPSLLGERDLLWHILGKSTNLSWVPLVKLYFREQNLGRKRTR